MMRKKIKIHQVEGKSQRKSSLKDNTRSGFLPKWNNSQWMLSLILILLPFLIYYKSISFGYVLDDSVVITGNSFTKEGLKGIGKIFSTESFTGYFGEQKDLVQGARYRPLSIASFAVEYEIFGENPQISHFINTLLYGILGVVLFYWLHILMLQKPYHWLLNVAFIGTLIFIVHPIHTEAVANIKGRDEIMAFLFGGGALIFSTLWQSKKNVSLGVVSGICFFMALMAKENAITLLAIIPLSMYFFRNTSVITSLKFAIPALLATIIYLWIRYAVIGYLYSSGESIQDIMNNPFVEMDGNQKYATVFYTLWKYIQLSIYPHPLSHDYYPYAISKLEWSHPGAYLSLLTYIGLCTLALYAVVRRNNKWFGLIFFLITLTIVSNLVINMGTFMNERFIFMPVFGICTLLAVFITELIAKKDKLWVYPIIGYFLLSSILVGYIYKTMSRVPDWENALTLNRSAVKVNPGSARANTFMSTALFEMWKVEPESEEKYQWMKFAYYYADQSTKILPNYKNGHIMKAGTAAELYKFDKDLSNLLQVFGEVVIARPDIGYIKDYLEYLGGRVPEDILIHWYLENIYQKLAVDKKSIDYALVYLNLAQKQFPGNQQIQEALANSYQLAGNLPKAQQIMQNLY